MSNKLTEYFTLAKRYREATTNALVRKTILEIGMPNLLATTGNPSIRKSISKFIQENTNDYTVSTARS